MNKYRKVKVIGKGSFGFAVLVRMSGTTDEHYVMKIIDIGKMDAKQRSDAVNEIQVLKSLRNPFIVTYHESFVEKKSLCIVMDYADGGDLYTKINDRKKLGALWPEASIQELFAQICLALKHVHDKRILHRDLKTQNIFLTSKGEVKMGDFGISRVLQHTFDCARTAIGTPYYLSPEICQDKPYNQRSDIWSLGCLLYEMVTLSHAFDASSMKGLVMKILRGNYPPISKTYSKELSDLIALLLRKNPDERPTVNQVLQSPYLQKTVLTVLDKFKVNESHPEFYKEVTELVGGSQPDKKSPESKPSPETNERKPLSNILQVNCIKTRAAERGISRSKSPLFPGYRGSPREIEQSGTNLAAKSPRPGESSKSRSKIKSSVFGDKHENHPPMSRPGSFLGDVNCTNSQQKVVPAFSSFLKKMNNLKSSKAADMSGDDNKENQKRAVNMLPGLTDKETKAFKTDPGYCMNKKSKEVDPQPFATLTNNPHKADRDSITGDSQKHQSSKIVQDEPLCSRNIFQGIPDIEAKDSMGYKIEALKFYLEKKMGLTVLLGVYRSLVASSEDGELKEQELPIMTTEQEKFVPFVHHLVFCELNYYSSLAPNSTSIN